VTISAQERLAGSFRPGGMAQCLRPPPKPIGESLGASFSDRDGGVRPIRPLQEKDSQSNVLEGIWEEMKGLRSGMTEEMKGLRASLAEGQRELAQELQGVRHELARGPQTKRSDTMAKSEGLDSPMAGAGLQHREVELSLIVRRIFDVATVEQTFGVTLNISMRWRMPHGEKPPDRSEDDGDWEPIWTPKFRIRSMTHTISRECVYSTVTSPDGAMYVTAEIYLLVVISTQLDLHVFPNDCQNFVIGVASMLPVDMLRFVPRRDGTPMVTVEKSRCLLNDFAFVEELPFTYDLMDEHISASKTVSKLRIKVKVARKSSHYLVNVACIMFLICSFVLCSWSLHPADIADRHQADFALILTAVAFKLVLMEMLPPISYLTTLDVYILSGFLFLAAATVSHSLLPAFCTDRIDRSPLTRPPVTFVDEQELINADLVCFYAFAGSWVAWNVFFAAKFVMTRSRTYSAFLAEARKELAQSSCQSQTIDGG